MAEIATWSAILNKTGLGKTSNECPTKAELLALNNGKDSNVDKVIVISNAASYGNNECVKLEDTNGGKPCGNGHRRHHRPAAQAAFGPAGRGHGQLCPCGNAQTRRSSAVG